MSLSLNIHINNKLFLKDPGSSETGKKILEAAVKQITLQGIEHVTFKRLAEAADTVESTVYRYFENKHNLLVYLSAWYWACMEYCLEYETMQPVPAEQQVRKAIDLMAGCCKPDIRMEVSSLDELRELMICEHAKVYMTHEVAEENKDGYFYYMKSFAGKLSRLIQEMNPEYPHARSLAFTMMIALHQQLYVSKNLPSLSSCGKGNDQRKEAADFTFSLLTLALTPSHGSHRKY